MFPISIFLKRWSKVQRVCYLCCFVPTKLETSPTHPVLITDRIAMTPRFCSAHARLERKHKKSRRKTKDLLFPSGRFQPARAEITNWLSGTKKQFAVVLRERSSVKKQKQAVFFSLSVCLVVERMKSKQKQDLFLFTTQCLFCFLEQESNER